MASAFPSEDSSNQSEEIHGRHVFVGRASEVNSQSVQLVNLHRQEWLAEVRLVGEDGYLLANRKVLYAASGYFRKILDSPRVEGVRSGRVLFRQYNVEVLALMLEYIYTGQTRVVKEYSEQVDRLFSIFSREEIKKLVQVPIENYICESCPEYTSANKVGDCQIEKKGLNIPSDVMESLLEYTYLGQTWVPEKYIQQVARLACLFEMDELLKQLFITGAVLHTDQEMTCFADIFIDSAVSSNLPSAKKPMKLKKSKVKNPTTKAKTEKIQTSSGITSKVQHTESDISSHNIKRTKASAKKKRQIVDRSMKPKTTKGASTIKTATLPNTLNFADIFQKSTECISHPEGNTNNTSSRKATLRFSYTSFKINQAKVYNHSLKPTPELGLHKQTTFEHIDQCFQMERQWKYRRNHARVCCMGQLWGLGGWKAIVLYDDDQQKWMRMQKLEKKKEKSFMYERVPPGGKNYADERALTAWERKEKEVGERRRHADEVDKLDQYQRRNVVRLSGIAESDVPNQENTGTIVLDLVTSILGLSVKQTKIVRSNRVGKAATDRPRDILVEFVSHKTKTAVMKSWKTLTAFQVFVNEDLTRLRGKLAYWARDLRRQNKIMSTWTRDGTIFVKLDSGAIKRVDTKAEYNAMCLEHRLPLPSTVIH